jgi:hypothetical protein
MRFFVRIRGAFTPPPNILTPVAKIPLSKREIMMLPRKISFIYKAAPLTDNETARAMPVNAH